MAQQLIVEGKDAIFLANICKKRGLNPPTGYETEKKFKHEFVKIARGIGNVSFALTEALNKPDIKNIGIVVDANKVGPKSRFDALVHTISESLELNKAIEYSLDSAGFVGNFIAGLRIGIWVMPDNISNGYLEHFAASLINSGDPTFEFAQEKLVEYRGTDYCNFKEVKQQKALVHTYLALQKEPGHPLGLAVKEKYLNAHSKKADAFVTWFENTFELSP